MEREGEREWEIQSNNFHKMAAKSSFSNVDTPHNGTLCDATWCRAEASAFKLCVVEQMILMAFEINLIEGGDAWKWPVVMLCVRNIYLYFSCLATLGNFFDEDARAFAEAITNIFSCLVPPQSTRGIDILRILRISLRFGWIIVESVTDDRP